MVDLATRGLTSGARATDSSPGARHSPILAALPAHVALLDARGSIVAVNQAWRHFAADNGMADPSCGVGIDYVAFCDSAPVRDADEAPQVASGIRRVLAGSADSFQIEYPCHSPTRQRWFVMTVTPLNDPRVDGAVVMHVDVTALRLAQDTLRDSESKFRQMAESITDVFFLFELGSGRVLYVSPSYLPVWGNCCDSLYAAPGSWLQALHPDDREAAWRVFNQGLTTGRFAFECRNTLPGRSLRWLEIRGYPVREGGEVVRIAAVAKDITRSKQTEFELQQSRRQFASAFSAAGDPMLMVDDEHRIELCNPAAERMFGYTAADLLGRPLAQLLPPPERAGPPAAATGLGAKPRSKLPRLTSGRRKDGSRFPIEATIAHDDVGRSGLHSVILRDISERLRGEAAAAHLNRLHGLHSAISARVVQVQERGALLRDACRIAVEVGGFETAWIGVVDPDTGEDRLAACHGADHAGIAPMQPTARNDVPDDARPASRAPRLQHPVVQAGSVGVPARACFPLAGSAQAEAVLTLLSSDPQAFDRPALALLEDMARQLALALCRIEQQDAQAHQALYDPLTGLARRPLFIERLAQYLRDAGDGGPSPAVFVLELDGPAPGADDPALPAADALLAQMALWLGAHAGHANLWARLEGNRFAAVLPVVRPDGNLGHLVDKTLAAMQGHAFGQADAVYPLSVRIGMALPPPGGRSAEGLLVDAEAALRHARRTGGRCSVFSPAMAVAAGCPPTLAQQMRQALARQEFVLHYQPTVDLVSGRLTGAEALLRWQDRRGGLVAPGHFIPALEQAGLMREVGRWALRQAVADARRWRDAGSGPLRVAVNLSAQQWRHHDFVADITRLIAGDAAVAQGLALECSEGLLMADVPHAIATLKALQALGVATSVDDFGTGYSSLTCLSRLPLDTLKIDGCFVAAMTTGPEGLALVSTLIQMAHSLKLAVVAEGVETPEQSRLLRLLGCGAMQGFLVGRAVDGDTFADTYLRQREPG